MTDSTKQTELAPVPADPPARIVKMVEYEEHETIHPAKGLPAMVGKSYFENLRGPRKGST